MTVRQVGRLAVIMLLGAVLTGCQLRVATDITVDVDGSGQIEVAILIDDELATALADAEIDIVEGLEESASGASWAVVAVDEVDAKGVRLSATFATPAELGQRVDALSSALTLDDGALLRDVELVVTDEGGYELTAAAGIDPPRIVGSLPLEAGADVAFDGDDLARALAGAGDELALAELRVSFPTAPVAPGATVELSTATWKLSVDGLQTVTAMAPPVPVATSLVLVIAAAIAGLVLALFAVRAFRRR